MKLPILQDRLKNPTEFKEDLLGFIREQSLTGKAYEVNIQKKIAGTSFFHQKSITDLRTVFFSGEFAQDQTNVQNNFTRPQDEHSIIYGIRILEADGFAPLTSAQWEEVTNGAVLNGTITIEVNGNTQLRRYPLTALKQNQTGDFFAMFELDELIFWGGQTDLKAVIELPALPLSTDLRVELLSVSLIS